MALRRGGRRNVSTRFFAAQQNQQSLAGGHAVKSKPRANERHRTDLSGNVEHAISGQVEGGRWQVADLGHDWTVVA